MAIGSIDKEVTVKLQNIQSKQSSIFTDAVPLDSAIFATPSTTSTTSKRPATDENTPASSSSKQMRLSFPSLLLVYDRHWTLRQICCSYGISCT